MFFCILDSGTNQGKNELIVVVVCSASGGTLPVNLTIIPLTQKWVFHNIYKLAFPHLYSFNVGSMNRLLLTNENKAEYEPFHSAISKMKEFKHSTVMLCTFHAIWQSFMMDLYPILDLCEHGQLIDE